jgi:2-polyprenyl-6-methoxyphenol hydroxylase-like FAD-dependent oxidoreductase
MAIPSRALIAGAGPVGLAAALRLQQLGVAATVLERRAEPNRASRASTFHSPTLELFSELGVLEEVRPLGHRVDAIHYYSVTDGRFAAFDLSLLAPHTPYPQRLHLEQTEFAAAVARRLTEPVVFDADIVDVRQDASGVAATVRSADGERIERAQYLIAADGARGRIRDALGIAFEGEAYGHRVLRVFTKVDLSTLIPDVAAISYIFDGDASCSLLRMPDVWRIIFRIAPDESDETALVEANIRARFARFLPPGGADIPIAGTDIYRVERRVAASYRVGRVLIAGDAAHITNTRGGMNMNCGLQDAVSAAEAIAVAIHDPIAGEAALSRYAAERRKIATDMLIPRTDRVVAGGPAWLEKVRATAADPVAAENFLLGTSMLDMSGPRFAIPAEAAAA